MSELSQDRGAGVVILVALLAAFLTLVASLAAVGRVATARARASGSADLAALAGAGPGGCAAAAAVASANGASMISCEPVAPDVIVRVRVPVTLLTRSVDVTASARAGPP